MGDDLAIFCIVEVDFVEKEFVDWTVGFHVVPDGAHMEERFAGAELRLAHFTSQQRESDSF